MHLYLCIDYYFFIISCAQEVCRKMFSFHFSIFPFDEVRLVFHITPTHLLYET